MMTTYHFFGIKLPISIGLICLLFHTQLSAQGGFSYQVPPDNIEQIIEAPKNSECKPSPTGEYLLQLHFRSEYLPISELARPQIQITGMGIDPESHFPTGLETAKRLDYKHTKGDTSTISFKGMPSEAEAAIFSWRWSPDGEKIAFCNLGKHQVELWVANTNTGSAHKVSSLPVGFPLNYNPLVWMPDSQALLLLTLPDSQAKTAYRDSIVSPVVQENNGHESPVRPGTDVLTNKVDVFHFKHYLSGILTMVDLTGDTKKLTGVDVFSSFSVSPNGDYILMETVSKPYPYHVSLYKFPSQIRVIDLKNLKTVTIADLSVKNKPLGRDAVTPQPRNFAWRPDQPSSLYWVEALDEGNPAKESLYRDQVIQLEQPFKKENKKVLAKTKNRFEEIFWYNDTMAIVSETWWNNRKAFWTSIDPLRGSLKDSLTSFPIDDVYQMPGYPYLSSNEFGEKTLHFINDSEFLTNGFSYSEKHGLQPTLNAFDIREKTISTLWLSSAPYYEVFADVLDEQNQKILIKREGKTSPVNYVSIDLSNQKSLTLTDFKDPYTHLRAIEKVDIHYKRADSLDLNATVYLPNRKIYGDQPFPTLVWTYPVEYKTKSSASNRYNSPYKYQGIFAPEMLLPLAGFALVHYPSFPIIGEGDQHPNDTFLKQLAMNAEALISKGAELQIIDSSRVAIGGHSYGAFAAANLLTHTSLFKTGIAQNGAYNRLLTPFGFQKEQRSYWQAPALYNKLSPFQNADKLKYPILLIHGEEDNNPGTLPFQSERYFNALQGLGAEVRYVQLPYEKHYYKARETVSHVIWEMIQWLDTELNNDLNLKTSMSK